MEINLRNVKVSELISGYVDDGEKGVLGYSGQLNIRPAYQREFIYKEKQRNAVIETVFKGFPLNTMYWAVAGSSFELMDGQQRTVSICQYVNGDFSVNLAGSPKFFANLTQELKKSILNYQLSVYVCEGSEIEKLDWFKIINIAGEKLTDQELRNAIYTGPWLADAKKWFSRSGAPALAIGSKYLKGTPIRQDYLETALTWLSKGDIKNYMAAHQNHQNANELWTYFQNVINWVKLTFPNYRRSMKGVAWGPLYDEFKTEEVDTAKLEAEISRLVIDDDVTRKSGIYEYVLSGNERALSLRAFSEKMRSEAFERQKGKCQICKETFSLEEMEADHIVPWSKGGRTIAKNCQMLCRTDNRLKGGK